MHDIKYILENLETAKEKTKARGFDCSILDEIITTNEGRKQFTTEVEAKRAEVKKLSKEIGMLKRQQKDSADLEAQVKTAKEAIAELEVLLEGTQKKLNTILSTIPNFISDDTPIGSAEEENQESFKSGDLPSFDFKPKDHSTLGEDLGLLDFETAAKVTGSRFSFYKGSLARLERALINFMLNEHTNNGYTEIVPPFIVHERALYGTGQLPKFKEDLFKLEGHDWYLIPTAEVPLTNLKREELFKKEELPLMVCAYTPCFRSEAGSYGKDTRGLIRQHQFNKVELVNIVAAENSVQAHENMINRARSILDSLKLPYRGMTLCSGDIGFGAIKTIDLEVWLPSQDKYREISSISNCGDFQARRASIRYRNDEGKPTFAHTLNGSGLAVGRTLLAIMENYQNEDGTITVPEVLKPYMGGVEKIS